MTQRRKRRTYRVAKKQFVDLYKHGKPRSEIMLVYALTGLVSACTSKKYRIHASKVNKAPFANLLARKFSDRLPGACVVSDMTYFRVGA